jgi:hypothetical protein
MLSAHTHTFDDCYFCLWDGWPFPESVEQRPKVSVADGARIPARGYFLFHGPSPAAGEWGATEFSSHGPARFPSPSNGEI